MDFITYENAALLPVAAICATKQLCERSSPFEDLSSNLIHRFDIHTPGFFPNPSYTRFSRATFTTQQNNIHQYTIIALTHFWDVSDSPS